jgi:hypothetical protein
LEPIARRRNIASVELKPAAALGRALRDGVKPRVRALPLDNDCWTITWHDSPLRSAANGLIR